MLWKYKLIRIYLVLILSFPKARRYSPLEKQCERNKCQGLGGLELTKCTRKCISQSCYDELYAWDEVRGMTCNDLSIPCPV